MEQGRVERRLAAILSADVAGYSRLIGIDEEGTLARLKAVRGDLVDAMALPLAELRELRPEDREHMIDGFRKAGLPVKGRA